MRPHGIFPASYHGAGNLERSLGHESFHALLRSGRIRHEEWRNHLRPAGEIWAARFGTAEAYERHTPERLAGEACARAFGGAFQTRTLRSPGAVPVLAPGEGHLAPGAFAAEDIPGQGDLAASGIAARDIPGVRDRRGG